MSTTISQTMSAKDRSDTVVFSSGGRRYHQSSGCPAFQSGRDLWDFDPWVDYTPATYNKKRVHEETEHDAVVRGKDPCRVCLPDNPLPPRLTPDFGHEMVTLPFSEIDACARCITKVSFQTGDPNVDDGWETVDVAAPWPCTSAIVLGLIPRDGASQ